MSLAVRIIPCLDVRGGRVVKGINFKDIVDAGDPAEAAKRYDAEGADEICMLDIDASFEERSTTIETVKSIASQVFIPFTVGGGIKSLKDIDMLLKSGADKVSINTSAILNPDLIEEASKEYGAQCIVLAIDAKQNGENWNVYTHGGKNKTDLDAIEWAKKGQDLGAGEILMTSMDKDGTKSGFDNNLYEELSNNLSIPVIASGGVKSIDDLRALKESFRDEIENLFGVISGRALYERKLSVAEGQALLDSNKNA